MKKKLLFLISYFWCVIVFSQSLSPEVTTSAGEYFVGTNATLSWTLGETIIETTGSGDIILTQGFQQLIYQIVAVQDFDSDIYDVRVYPIPAKEFINIEIISSIEPVKLLVELYDMMGSKIYYNFVESSTFNHRLYLNQYQNNLLFLKITNITKQQVKTFKIIKIKY